MPKQPQPQIPYPNKGKAANTPSPSKPTGLPADCDDEVFEEDFTDVTDGYPMAAEGFHHAKVIDFEKSESSKGNPQYVWQFRITAGDSKDTEIRTWTSLLPQARWKTAETLAAIGIEAAGSVARFRKSDIIGRPCILEVIHDTYDNKTNHKVSRVHPPNDDSIKYAKGGSEDAPF